MLEPEWHRRMKHPTKTAFVAPQLLAAVVFQPQHYLARFPVFDALTAEAAYEFRFPARRRHARRCLSNGRGQPPGRASRAPVGCTALTLIQASSSPPSRVR